MSERRLSTKDNPSNRITAFEIDFVAFTAVRGLRGKCLSPVLQRSEEEL